MWRMTTRESILWLLCVGALVFLFASALRASLLLMYGISDAGGQRPFVSAVRDGARENPRVCKGNATSPPYNVVLTGAQTFTIFTSGCRIMVSVMGVSDAL